ncbi:MAG: hypothetical protein JWM11_2447, partial [Planctomycetaceae bacterium]|nr:hypothetical protein [Planctomycetaceae bacterium]
MIPRHPHSIRPIEGISEFRIPDSWQNAAVLENGVYFIIPSKLLDSVVREVSLERFATADLERELEIAKAAGDGFGNVAIWNGVFVSYPDLGPLAPIKLDADAAKILGINPQKAGHLARVATERLKAVNCPRRAYLGWLLTQRMFLDEHDSLLGSHGSFIQQNGFPKPSFFPAKIKDRVESTEANWIQAYSHFCGRWRLQSLALPYLPIPLPMLIPNVFSSTGIENAEGTLSASIPDIYPTGGQGLLSETFEDALRGRGRPDHLNGWFKIVTKSNAAKNVIPVYDRWF